MGTFGKVVFSLVAFLSALFPFWLWLLARTLLGPAGFWQNFIVMGAGVWLLGGLQLILLIVFVVFLVHLWE